MEKVGPRDPKITSREWGKWILNNNIPKQLDDDLFPKKKEEVAVEKTRDKY